ncbi:glycoside hydrolase family 88 protein [Archangium sp.]|uniref:glycoside hydrolase family 88 protein n=1 Tax=Archangium sp. TaxID=1872627 RepID=UPI00389A944F
MLAALPARAFDDATADRALQVAQQKLRATATNPAIPTTQYPKATTDDVSWRLVPNTANIDWVQGFFPGQLWLMYDQGRDPFWRGKADAWTRSLEVQKTQSDIRQITHDIGFKFMTSYGQAYRLTGDEYYHQVMLTAADTLARRYNSTVGVIDCCDWNDPVWHVPMVTDTMMDLELLFWAARNGGDPAWNNMALSHALKTAADMVRADGGTFHVVDYNTSGGVISKSTFQGFSNSSTWSRGQAWAIYGFTMAYRYTRDARMLQAAQKVTEYWLSHLPADFVPNWDFNAPSQQKDSSAAAAVASALLELSQYVTDPATAQRYRNAALSTLDSLSSTAYLNPATSGGPGILLHGTAFYKTPIKPSGEDIDKSLIYGDYYFVEALSRFKLWNVTGWRSTLGFPESVQSLGTGNTGVRIIEYDVTPLSKVIDGVVGYTGSSVSVTAYSSLPMAVRMNPSGFLDVRRGGEYAALASVPYEAKATYHVRIRADLGARNYSVWVTPQGGAEVLLADRFAFRSDAPAISDIGKVSLKSGHFNDEFRVTNHSIRSETQTPQQWTSTLNWAQSVHDLGTGNTGLRETEFDVTPLAKPIDGVIGYADTSTTVTGYPSLAMAVRMNNSGFFDVRNGANYAALVSQPYVANTTYHVRMRTDLNAKTYSVWVRPPGGTEVLLADRFAFRSDAPPTDDLGKVALKSGVTETEFRVTGHLVRIPTTPAPSPAPSEPIEAPAPDDSSRLTPQGDSEGGGCSSVPGATFAATGLLLWLLRPGRPSRAPRRQR